jgi:hypothetical protein
MDPQYHNKRDDTFWALWFSRSKAVAGIIRTFHCFTISSKVRSRVCLCLSSGILLISLLKQSKTARICNLSFSLNLGGGLYCRSSWLPSLILLAISKNQNSKHCLSPMAHLAYCFKGKKRRRIIAFFINLRIYIWINIEQPIGDIVDISDSKVSRKRLAIFLTYDNWSLHI